MIVKTEGKLSLKIKFILLWIIFMYLIQTVQIITRQTIDILSCVINEQDSYFNSFLSLQEYVIFFVFPGVEYLIAQTFNYLIFKIGQKKMLKKTR